MAEERTVSESQALAIALQHHQAGRLAQAEAIYRDILSVSPNNADACHLLGLVAHQTGRHPDAVQWIERAIASNPGVPYYWYNLGEAYRASGRFADAVARYERVIASQPNLAQAHMALGHALRSLGRLSEAVQRYEKALEIEPGLAEARNGLGLTLLDQGKFVDAAKQFEQTLALNADYAEAHNNLGLALHEQGRFVEAIQRFERVLRLKPGLPVAHVNLGNALRALGKFSEAIRHYEQALATNPDLAEAHMNLGLALHEEGRLGRAIQCYERALQLKPDYAMAHANLGLALLDQGLIAEAVPCCRRALELDPALAEAHLNLAHALRAQGNLPEATGHYERALELQPDFFEARWCLAISRIPIVYKTAEEIDASRAAYASSLDELKNWVARAGNREGLWRAVGSQQPFYLAYQGRNDRELQGRYGEIACSIMTDWLGRERYGDSPKAGKRGDRLRVGIVSGHIRRHSVWDVIVAGLLRNIDRARFDVFVCHTRWEEDDEARRIGETAGVELLQGPMPLQQWVHRIRDHRPDVLFYPEIGMDPVTARLAAMRLAPVQVAGWGHPDTSGLPTMDYFLSGELMEPPGAEEHYTERLVRLPNLGCFLDPLPIEDEDVDLADLGIRDDGRTPRYVCGQQTFKYLPQYDWIFPRIAQAVGYCQFVFFEFQRPPVFPVFRERIERAFRKVGLEPASYCVYVRAMPRNRFYGLLRKTEIFLDTLGFSGFTTAFQVLEHGMPMVTMEGEFMRGRLASGILRRIGVTDTIAANPEEYVDLAIRLGQDARWRHAIGERIAANLGVIYGDFGVVRAFENFLERAVGRL